MTSIGSTRNLTSQFLKLRSEARRALGIAASTQEQATARLVGAALESSSVPSNDVEMASASPHSPPWLHKAEKIRTEMSIVKDRMHKLKEAHQRALLVTFDSDDDSQAHVDAITRDVQASLRRLDKEVRGIAQVGGPNEDSEVKVQVQRQLASALMKLTMEFRKEQTRFLNKKEAQKGIKVGGTLGLVETDSQLNLAETDPGFTQDQLAMVDLSNVLAEERDQEIRKIIETIGELTQIMQDMAALVVEQGTILDRIDRNIVETSVKVEEGVKQIQAAEKTQKASRMMMCIIGLVVAIVLLLIVVIIRKA